MLQASAGGPKPEAIEAAPVEEICALPESTTDGDGDGDDDVGDPLAVLGNFVLDFSIPKWNM